VRTGHKTCGAQSLQTTSIYVQAEKKHMLEEVAGYYMRRAERRTVLKN
jgi:hypothetical protein